jgi:hypothetical protein
MGLNKLLWFNHFFVEAITLSPSPCTQGEGAG